VLIRLELVAFGCHLDYNCDTLASLCNLRKIITIFQVLLPVCECSYTVETAQSPMHTCSSFNKPQSAPRVPFAGSRGTKSLTIVTVAIVTSTTFCT